MNPIAAAIAPARPSRMPYSSVAPGAATGPERAPGGEARSGHSNDTAAAYTEPAIISRATPAALLAE